MNPKNPKYKKFVKAWSFPHDLERLIGSLVEGKCLHVAGIDLSEMWTNRRFWMGTIVSAGTYIGVVFGWMILTAFVLGVNLLDLTANIKWWAIGLVAGLVTIPALRLGERLR